MFLCLTKYCRCNKQAALLQQSCHKMWYLKKAHVYLMSLKPHSSDSCGLHQCVVSQTKQNKQKQTLVIVFFLRESTFSSAQNNFSRPKLICQMTENYPASILMIVQPLYCEYLLVFLASCNTKLNILGLWTVERKQYNPFENIISGKLWHFTEHTI